MVKRLFDPLPYWWIVWKIDSVGVSEGQWDDNITSDRCSFPLSKGQLAADIPDLGLHTVCERRSKALLPKIVLNHAKDMENIFPFFVGNKPLILIRWPLCMLKAFVFFGRWAHFCSRNIQSLLRPLTLSTHPTIASAFETCKWFLRAMARLEFWLKPCGTLEFLKLGSPQNQEFQC